MLFVLLVLLLLSVSLCLMSFGVGAVVSVFVADCVDDVVDVASCQVSCCSCRCRCCLCC